MNGLGKTIPARHCHIRQRQRMEQLLTVDDVAELLQMTPRFVEQQIRLDFLDIIKIGNDVRIERSAYGQYLENRKTVTPFVGRQRLEAVD